MNDGNKSLIPERNPVTHKKHRREVFWQITLPLIIGLLVMVGLEVLLATQSKGITSNWADISAIWIIIPACIGGVIWLAVLVGLVVLHVWLIRKIPLWSFKIQDVLGTVGALARSGSDKIVAPLLKINGFFAGAKAADRKLRRR